MQLVERAYVDTLRDASLPPLDPAILSVLGEVDTTQDSSEARPDTTGNRPGVLNGNALSAALGHPPLPVLRSMVRRGAVNGLPDHKHWVQPTDSAAVAAGRQRRQPALTKRADDDLSPELFPGQVWSFDVCGPFIKDYTGHE